MTDMSSNRNNASESQRTLIVSAALLAVCIMAYAFAAGEWNLAGAIPLEGQLASNWQQFGLPTEIELAKRR
jgi:hypothetical protein